MSETVHVSVGLQIKKFDLTCGRLTLVTIGLVEVRFPDVSDIRQIWLDCGGSGKVFHVISRGNNGVGCSLVLEVDEHTSQMVRNDFCKFLARACIAQ